MAPFRQLLPSLAPVALVAVLALGAVIAGLLPLTMPLGLAAGGVLDTGQAEPARWWLGMAVAFGLYLLVSRKWSRAARLWWLAVLAVAMMVAVVAFVCLASSGQPRVAGKRAETIGSGPLAVGVITALPLFWPEGRGVDEILAPSGNAGPPALSGHPVRAIDHADAGTLREIDALLIAQPRLLQPKELVALDQWVRAGGRALIFADPLLAWPGGLPPGDPRRPPLTSLLDPLLTHWGLRLEAASPDIAGVERRMLGTGHVVLLAGASRFSLLPGGKGATCRLAERGLMALCRIGGGEVRLVADADLLDARLWLADPRYPARAGAWSADIPALVDAWLERPLDDPRRPAPRRVVSEGALAPAMRAAILVIFLVAGLGGAGVVTKNHLLLSRNGKVKGNGGGTKDRRRKKMR